MPSPTQIDPGLIEIHRLFATPIASIEVPITAALNRSLADYILTRCDGEASTQHSNIGGWQSTPDLCDWDHPAIRTLLDFSRSFVDRLTAVNSAHGLVEPSHAWKMEGWANVNAKGCSNALHAHPGAFWSLVYWVDDGRDLEETDNGGQLEFHDPRGILPAMYAPALRFRIEGCLNAGYTQAVTATSGRLIAFPSWLQHCVTTYTGTRPRISIALNFSL
ncbi:TIGR02466 family protein [Herbaspirillum robiniae]|uniref:TIGR02466 family protein n=1 Tax=Herbaspirillum robiniae TaxID=2014887 RepID=UPI003D782AEB